MSNEELKTLKNEIDKLKQEKETLKIKATQNEEVDQKQQEEIEQLKKLAAEKEALEIKQKALEEERLKQEAELQRLREEEEEKERMKAERVARKKLEDAEKQRLIEEKKLAEKQKKEKDIKQKAEEKKRELEDAKKIIIPEVDPIVDRRINIGQQIEGKIKQQHDPHYSRIHGKKREAY